MKNFIFDLYGTLVDIHTDENSARFKNYYGKDFWAEFNRLCSLSEDPCFEPDISPLFANGISAKQFRERSRMYIKTYRGVHTLLKKLKEGGAGLYVLSNAQSCFTCDELELLRIEKYFDGIELSSDFGKKKPSIDFFNHIIDKYSLNRSECIYVGNDFHSDVFGAKAAGLHTAYIKSNISPAGDKLEEVARVADFATSDFKQLSSYLINLLPDK